MSDSLSRVLSHVARTLESLPAGTLAAFPSMSRGAYRELETAEGSRLKLEEQVGQSRVFALGLDDLEQEPIRLGGSVPRSFLIQFPVVLRYEAGRPNRLRDILSEISLDQRVAVDAMHRSDWPSVAGCVSLQAQPGDIQKFVLSDDAGNSYEGYTSEVVITCSIDT